jgi:hypothetical protein
VYDSANRIVDTPFTYTDVDVLRPGEKSPFDIILDDKDQISKASRYELSVSSVNSDPKPSNLKLTIGDNYYDDLGYAHVLGEVTDLEHSDANIFEDSGLPRKEPPVVFTVVTTSCYYFYCTRSTGVFILLIIFLASLNRDLSQESRCEVVITTKS